MTSNAGESSNGQNGGEGNSLASASTNSVASPEGRSSRGPKSARGEVRQRIISCARTRFQDGGYDATTMSAVARDAGCTPAMVTYYFESKQRLFRECMNLPRDPAEEILNILAQGWEGAGSRIVERALHWYEDELTADTMRTLAGTLLTDTETSQRFRDYLRYGLLDEVSQALGMTDELAEEVEFAVATMFGVVVMRYLVCLEPITSMSQDRLIAELGPVIQHRVDRARSRAEARAQGLSA